MKEDPEDRDKVRESERKRKDFVRKHLGENAKEAKIMEPTTEVLPASSSSSIVIGPTTEGLPASSTNSQS